MKYEAMPVIRLEVDHMKHQILHHLGVNGSELGERLSQEIERAVESYPWQHKVDEIVHQAITEQIKNYFGFGEGREMVKGVLSEAFSKTFKGEPS